MIHEAQQSNKSWPSVLTTLDLLGDPSIASFVKERFKARSLELPSLG
jgi:hypothetical protein